jgi:5-methyltetrahydrofolate--homocysteine methyltransferase
MPVDLNQLARVIASHAKGSDAECAALVKQALDEGLAPEVILDQGLIEGMRDVGIRFRDNLIFVPEVLISAKAMHAGLKILEPILTACGIEPVGKMVIGTVKGDIHDIGKNLVGMMLKGAGFEVIDLGVNTSLAKFEAAIEQHRPDLLGMSALLTTTMGQMGKNIQYFHEKGYIASGMRVMVGGAPLTQEYADRIGAHAHGKDASDAVQKALRLMEERLSPLPPSPQGKGEKDRVSH